MIEVTSKMAGVLANINERRDRLLEFLHAKRADREKLEELVFAAPPEVKFAVKHTQSKCVYCEATDNPAFTTVEQIKKSTGTGSAEAIIGGFEYQQFKGTYVGLRRYGMGEDEEPPFPGDDILKDVQVFLYARLFDGPRDQDELVRKERLRKGLKDLDANNHNTALTNDCK